jgi:acyl-CoA dehydrogenase
MRDIIESSVNRLFADKLGTAEIAAAERTWAASLWNTVEESGIACAAGPESSGGGVPWSDVYVIVRAIGQHAVPLPLAETLFSHWLLAAAGLEAPPGPLTFAVDRLSLAANGRVSGRLRGLPWGRDAGHVIAIAQPSVGQPSVVLLRTRDVPIELVRNIACEPRDTLSFENALPVAVALLPIALEGDVMRLGGAMLRSAQMAGGMQRILQESVQYAQSRRQFGRSIGSFQAIQHQIAVLAEHATAADCIAEAAFAGMRSNLPTLQIASAKIVASDAVSVGAALAHGIHGAIGLASEHMLNFISRRLWAWRSEYGSREMWARHIGKLACEGGEADFWSIVTRGTFSRPDKAEVLT